MSWRQFVMDLDTLNPATVEDVFTRLGACAVTFSDAGDDPVLEPAPGETPLWSNTRITGLFPREANMDALLAVLPTELGVSSLPAYHIEDLADRDWEREWLQDFGPMRFGARLWICPTAGARLAGDGRWSLHGSPARRAPAVVHLDPGLAFGTGTHATTALCLEWLDSIDLEGKTLLDYGCGSGVLAIAAFKLGCEAVTGVDIDPQALIATRQNAANNDVAEKLFVLGSPDEIEGKFDIVVANILAGPLVQFADSITSRLARGGMLALSGVLCEQADEVMAAYVPWIEFEESACREQDGQVWSRLTGSKRQS